MRRMELRPNALRIAVALFVVLPVAGCNHHRMVELQEASIAPQRNWGHADDPVAELTAVQTGTTQQQVIDKFGLPVMVHTEGRALCSPWDACTYPRSAFIYRSKEASTCTIHFAQGAVDQTVTCKPYLEPVILGPGDVDPQNGMTAKG